MSLFCNESVLEEALRELDGLGYSTVEIASRSFQEFTRDVSNSGLWSGYDFRWNGSLDALSDGLAYISWPTSNRLALCIRRFDRLWYADKETFHGVIDVLANSIREELLFGRLLLVVIQTSDPNLEIPAVGGNNVLWNKREWMNKDRGLPSFN